MSDCAIVTSDIMDAYLESMDTFNDYEEEDPLILHKSTTSSKSGVWLTV